MDSVYKVMIGNTSIPTKLFRFSGGETQVCLDIPKDISGDVVNIYALVRDGNPMPLAMIVDALRRSLDEPKIRVHMPYLPYARQDRVMNAGESLAVGVFCEFINSLSLNSVSIDDCHSDVGTALLNRVKNDTTIHEWCFSGEFDCLVSPDAGSLKRINKQAKTLGITDIVRADKTRDVNTGNITGTVVHGDVKGKRVLIIDDLIDGGASYTNLGAKLKECGASKVSLYATHGIFSRGKGVFVGTVDDVFTKYDWTEL